MKNDIKLLDKVKKRLEENYGIDFLSEFWTDDQIVLLEDIVESTENEIKKLETHRIRLALIDFEESKHKFLSEKYRHEYAIKVVDEYKR